MIVKALLNTNSVLIVIRDGHHIICISDKLPINALNALIESIVCQVCQKK